MKYKITDDLGNDLLEGSQREIHELRHMIVKLQNRMTEQNIQIDNLKSCIIELQNQTINFQNSTLLDVLKNTFTKKKNSNITHSTVEIND